jgi:HEAT repeat protein
MSTSILNLTLAALLLLGATARLAGQPTPAAATMSEAQLIVVLKSDATQKEKADACLFLARVGTKAAVPALVALLPDERLSHMARYGLETIADPSVDAALRDALNTLQGRQLVGVIGSLGVRHDAKAVKPLSGRLQDPDPDVAQAAARALGTIGTASAVKALESGLAKAPTANQLAFCEGLLRCAESHAARGERKEALAIYQHLRGVPTLPHQVRAGALIGVIVHDPKQGPALIRASLHGQDYVLTAAAVRAAQRLPGTEVTQALTADLARLPADTQVLVAQTLGVRRDPAALPALVALAQSGSPPVRLAALRAVPMIGQASAVPVLVELLRDRDSDVAQAAQEGLAAIPGREADAAVMALLAGTDTAQRLTALELIGRRRMMGALPTLLKVAVDPEAKVRPAALRKLGELGGPSVFVPLLDLLLQAKDAPDLDAAEQALGAVAARGNNLDASVGQLIAALPRAPAAPKGALLGVLTTLGGPTALKAVRAAVDDPSPEVHAAALRALGAWKTADAAPGLLALARSAGSATDKMICLRGYLGWAANPELPPDQRLAMCREAADLIQQPDEKKLLLGTLGGIQTPESMALVVVYLEDAAAREEASAATVAIAEALLKGKEADQVAPKLVEPLQKAAKATTNEDLARRAQAQLKLAEAKVGAK